MTQRIGSNRIANNSITLQKLSNLADPNSAFNQANTAFTQANAAFNQANTAFTQANAAFNQANTISASMQIIGGANGTYYFTNYAPRPMTVKYVSGRVIGATSNFANVTIQIDSVNVTGLVTQNVNSSSVLFSSSTGANSVGLASNITAVIANSTVGTANSIVLTLGL